jgi:CubicO group peptidase (beta-lactamase class C family)
VLPGFRVADPGTSARVTPRHLLTHTSGIDGDFFYDTGRGDDCLAHDELGSGLKDYDVELVPLPDGRFAGRWPYQSQWTPLRFLRLAGGDVLHVSGRATPKVTTAGPR